MTFLNQTQTRCWGGFGCPRPDHPMGEAAGAYGRRWHWLEGLWGATSVARGLQSTACLWSARGGRL